MGFIVSKLDETEPTSYIGWVSMNKMADGAALIFH